MEVLLIGSNCRTWNTIMQDNELSKGNLMFEETKEEK